MSENEDVHNAVMIDLGSGWTKVGTVGADNPSSVFPTVIGRVNKGRLQSIRRFQFFSMITIFIKLNILKLISIFIHDQITYVTLLFTLF